MTPGIVKTPSSKSLTLGNITPARGRGQARAEAHAAPSGKQYATRLSGIISAL